MTANTININIALNPFDPAAPPLDQSFAYTVSDGDRIALASTALAILRLPLVLQQYSNARDMLDMLAGVPCGRPGYILGQAHHVLNTYSGFMPDAQKKVDWREHDETRADVEKLVAEALAERLELIAADEAFEASEKGSEKAA